MSPDKIIFQLATHYLPKIALRFETLYETIYQACQENHPIIHHNALKNVIEILKLAEKPEIKSRFLKELIRIEHGLSKNNDFSQDLLNHLYEQIQILSQSVGRFCGDIYNHAFLQSIRVSQSTHHLDGEIYSPELHLWLESSVDLRRHDLKQWLDSFQGLYQTVHVYLSLLRDSTTFYPIELINGFYQRPLPPKTSCHLILLQMDKAVQIVPKMQLGHHGLSLRLCEMGTMREVRETHAQLDLAICQL